MNKLLTRKQAAEQLELSLYEFDNLRTAGRLTPVSRPGRRRPFYRETEILAIRKQFEKEVAG